jgi:hypothetical protein
MDSSAIAKAPIPITSSRRVGLGVNRPIPDKKLARLVAAFRENMHMPDPAPLYVVVGTVAGNFISGSPVWTMLIGGASAGKTEVLLSTQHVKRVHMIGRLSGVSALLSGVPRKDVRAGSSGGILRDVGTLGIMMLTDFTSVLSLPKDTLGEILGAFTGIYDGEWSRDVGADGGRHLAWSGKCGFLAGCTPMIDRHQEMLSGLGPRFIQYRYPETEGYAETRMALLRRDLDDIRGALADAMARFFDDFEVDEDDLQLKPSDADRLIAMATLSARARSGVHRHAYTREVEGVPDRENPPRLGLELKQLKRGMHAAGVPSEERWRVLGKVALDGVPAVRRVMVLALADAETRKVRGASGGLGIGELVSKGKCSTQTIRRALEDLALHGVVKNSGGGAGSKGKGDMWELSGWMKEQWRVAYPKGYEGVLGEKFSGRA